MAIRSMPANGGPASSPAGRSRPHWAYRSRWPTSPRRTPRPGPHSMSRSVTRASPRASCRCPSIGGPPDVTAPNDLRYTRDHEWVRVDGDEATVGITQYAADQLGDIVFVELPEAGRDLEEAKPFGVVESVKAVSDLFAPISGEVTSTNDALANEPELVNRDPYGAGWMVRMTVTDSTQLDDLLDGAGYDELVAAG